MQLVARLTKDIVETYQICNPAFKYSEAINPKRFLTSPSVGVLNDGFDNANSDLILTANFVLVNAGSHQRFGSVALWPSYFNLLNFSGVLLSSALDNAEKICAL